jgi:hypothetical protein
MTRKEKEKKKIYQRNSQHGLQPEVDSVGKENVPMMPKHAEKIPHRQWYVDQCCENQDSRCQGTADEGSQQSANNLAKGARTYHPGVQAQSHIREVGMIPFFAIFRARPSVRPGRHAAADRELA